MIRYLRSSYPVWSPDGSQIAFLSDRRNGFREIYLADPVSGMVRQVTDNSMHHSNLVWTPDGERIMFDARVGDHLRPRAEWGIFSVEVTHGRAEDNDTLETVINELDTELEFDVAISPDGETIAWVEGSTDPDQQTHLNGLVFAETHDIPGTRHRRADQREFWARWSPQGYRIAFTSTRDGHREIYVMDADGSNVRRLTFSR